MPMQVIWRMLEGDMLRMTVRCAVYGGRGGGNVINNGKLEGMMRVVRIKVGVKLMSTSGYVDPAIHF